MGHFLLVDSVNWNDVIRLRFALHIFDNLYLIVNRHDFFFQNAVWRSSNISNSSKGFVNHFIDICYFIIAVAEPFCELFYSLAIAVLKYKLLTLHKNWKSSAFEGWTTTSMVKIKKKTLTAMVYTLVSYYFGQLLYYFSSSCIHSSFYVWQFVSVRFASSEKIFNIVGVVRLLLYIELTAANKKLIIKQIKNKWKDLNLRENEKIYMLIIWHCNWKVHLLNIEKGF